MRREQSEARSPTGKPAVWGGCGQGRRTLGGCGRQWSSGLGARRASLGEHPGYLKVVEHRQARKAPPWLTRSSFQLSKPGGRELQPLHAGKELRESVRPNSSAPRSTPQKSRAQNILHGSRGGVHVHGKKR
jgi:hypothetical protein